MTSRRASVSLLMIVRNEAHQLADCLVPVAHLFDQIVIVDTGSQDKTEEVARRFTDDVFHFAWCDDFAAARNEALRHAGGEWIFWLDADDRLTPQNVAQLETLLAALDDQPAAYMMDTVCTSEHICEGERLVTHPRLFRRHPELRWQGRVHEQLRPCPAALGHALLSSDVQIHHVGYTGSALQQRKLQRDIRLLRMDYAVDPEDPSTLLHLGLAYARKGSPADARKYLRQLQSLEQRPLDFMRRVFGTLGELGLQEGKFDEVLMTTDEGLAQFPGDEHLLYLRAEALYELDQYDAARELLERIIAEPSAARYRGGVPNDIRGKLAPRSLAEVLRIQGHLVAAEQVLLSIVAHFPDDPVSWHSLGRIYIDTRSASKVSAVIERLHACRQGDVFGHLLVAAWEMLQGRFDRAGAALDQVVAKVPYMPLPRMMRAECLSRQRAPLAAQIQACRDVLRVQPSNAAALQFVSRAEAALAMQSAPSAPVHAPSPAGARAPIGIEAAQNWWTSVIAGAGVPDDVCFA